MKKIILVTGASRGVGRAIAMEFARRGAHVIVNYFHNEGQARSTVADIEAEGGSAEAIRASAAKSDQVGAMIREIADRHGRLDVLVNNAVRGVFGQLTELTEDDWAKILDVNLHGVRHCSMAARDLLAVSGGAIVNVSSHGARNAVAGYAGMGVAKAAVEGLTRYLALELAPLGIRVNAVSSPQMANAAMDAFPSPDVLAQTLTAATPGGRLTTELDLATVACFLGSSDARWMTGQTLLVDGGLSLGTALLSAPAPNDVPWPTEPVESIEPVEPEPIAIVGMGIVAPGIGTVDEFWSALLAGDNVFSPPAERFPLESLHSSDPAAADKTYARQLGIIHDDDATDLGRDYLSVWLEDALSQAAQGVLLGSAGLYVGTWAGGSQHLDESLVAHRLLARATDNGVEPLVIKEFLDAQLPRASLDLTSVMPIAAIRQAGAAVLGPDVRVLTADTACASGLNALDFAIRALRAGDVEVAFAAGTNSNTAQLLVAFSKLSGLSTTDTVSAFSTDADGTVFSDSSAAIALKTLSRAKADGDTVLAVVESVGLSSDGKGKAIYAPNSAGQRLAVERAYAPLPVDGPDVFIAHGTGTVEGDRTELETLTSVALQGSQPYCVSTKSVLGHTGWSAGIASVLHAVLALRHGRLPAQPIATTLSDAATTATVVVPTTPVTLPVTASRRRIGVSAFGFGGTNAHVVISDPPANFSLREKEELTDLVVVGIGADRPVGKFFPQPYPLPNPVEYRLPTSVLSSIDATQLSSFAAAKDFVARHGEIWADVRDSTGVFTANAGPLALGIDTSVRLYADHLTAHATDPALAKELARGIASSRAAVPPASNNTVPGLMPPVAGARIGAYYNLHGLSIGVDCGVDSSIAALSTAASYLSDGTIDLALIVGTNTQHSPQFCEALGVDEDVIAEGSVLVAVARQDTARERGWPILGTLTPRSGSIATPPSSAHYAGAQQLFQLVAALENGRGDVLSPQHDDIAARSFHVASNANAAPRHVIAFRPTASETVRSPLEFLPRKGILLGEGQVSQRTRHVRLVVDLRGQAWPALPSAEVVAAQELLFATAKEHARRLDSLVVLVLDDLVGGQPHPHAALFSGFVKGLIWEYPDVIMFTHVTNADAQEARAQCAAEFAFARSLPTIVYRDGVRQAEQLTESIAGKVENPDTVLRWWQAEQPVVLATGGARGLTATLVTALLADYPAQVWLVGSSPLAEPSTLSKADYISAERATRQSTTVRELSAEYDRVASARETWTTVLALQRKYGADRVHYRQVDVTDADQVARLVDEVGHVDLFVNGAGIHAATNIDLKSHAEFRRTQDVKVLGYLNFALAFGTNRPVEWCNFSSVTAAIGQPGLVDYVSANELLNYATRHNVGNLGAQEYAHCWTIWRESGMALRYSAVGIDNMRITPIDDAEGIRHFRAELTAPRTLDGSVVTYLGDDAYQHLRAQFPYFQSTPRPTGRSRYLGERHGNRWSVRFDPATDLVFQHHIVRNKPTLPGTFSVALAISAAKELMPGLHLRGVDNAEFLAFLHGNHPTSVTATVLSTTDGVVRVGVQTTADISVRGRVLHKDKPHFRCVVTLGPKPTAPKVPLPSLVGNDKTEVYYTGKATAVLTGIFANTSHTRQSATGGSALYAATPELAQARLDDEVTCGLLMDSTARNFWLAHTPADPYSVAIPRIVPHIDYYTDLNDVELLAKYQQIYLVTDLTSNTSTAIAPDGTVLLSMHDMEIEVIGL